MLEPEACEAATVTVAFGGGVSNLLTSEPPIVDNIQSWDRRHIRIVSIESPQIPMQHVQPNSSRDPILAALAGRIAAECSPWLARTSGTHALLLDAIGAPATQAAGLGRWTALSLG